MKTTLLFRHLAAAACCLLLPALPCHAQDDADDWRLNGRPECRLADTPLAPNRGAHRVGSRQTAPLTCMGSPRVPLVLVQSRRFSTR